MTEPFAEANDADLAEQALPVDDSGDAPDPATEYRASSAEANPADLIEQQHEVPSADDDYDRG